MARPVPSPALHRACAAILAAGIVVMAVIAGRHLRGTWQIDVHGYVGNAVFVVAIANLGIAALRRTGVAVAGLLMVLLFAQTGLGYVGRESLDAAAWHIPGGVLIMGLAGFQLAELRTRDRAAVAG